VAADGGKGSLDSEQMQASWQNEKVVLKINW
jgi:hypothetical protein